MCEEYFYTPSLLLVIKQKHSDDLLLPIKKTVNKVKDGGEEGEVEGEKEVQREGEKEVQGEGEKIDKCLDVKDTEMKHFYLKHSPRNITVLSSSDTGHR